MMTNRISVSLEEAIALSQQSNETDFCQIEATIGNIDEWASKEPLVLKILARKLG
jgi:hypothetical protein